MREYLAERRAGSAYIGADHEVLLTVLEDFVLRGGKRVRPAFAYWGWRSVATVPGPEGVPPEAMRLFSALELLQACADYPGASNARRITFEYVMLKDKNDSDDDARELVRLLKHYGLPAKVNLIPFNPWPGAPYECSTPERIRAFSNIVFEAGISAPVRTPRGRDIDAACGQLKTAAQKKSRAERDREAAAAQSA